MTRTDNDTWDIAAAVGATAVTTAAARAVETASEDPLISDPFAEMLLSGPELGEYMAKSTTMQRKAVSPAAHQQEIDYQAARTHFFDAFFIAAAAAGIRQHVILAAGLDSRAFRLRWPDGTTVFEIDQPKVLEYKSSMLAAHSAEPAANWCRVGVDLRQDWPKALRTAGLDDSLATCWLAEGLLPYLPGPAQDAMFDNIDSFSATGSRIAVEEYSSIGSMREIIAHQRAQIEDMRAQLDEDEDEDEVVALGDLWYDEDGRSDPADWFAGRGWRTESTAASEYLAQLGRPLGDTRDHLFPLYATFVTAEKP